MKTKQVITGWMMIALAAGLMLATIRQAEAQPLKVFILAGQSNMEGHANINTFDYLGCAKTFALMGQAFAEANLQLLAERKGG